MSWLFPDWAECDLELQNIFETLGVYAYANPVMSSGDRTVMDIHIFDMQKVVSVLPEHYKERFFNQYIWFKNILLRDDELIKANDIINKALPVLGAEKARRGGVEYLSGVLNKYSTENIMLLFAICMGIPIHIHIVDSSNMNDYTGFLSNLGIEDELMEFLKEYEEYQDEAFD